MQEKIADRVEAMRRSIQEIEKNMEQGMSQEALENAIKEVNRTIETLQKMQTQLQDEAIKSARPADAEDESPLKR